MIPSKREPPTISGNGIVLPMFQVRRFREWFTNREDIYCEQTSQGRFPWKTGTVDVHLIAEHLVGLRTISLSSASLRGMSRWLVFDADAEGGLQQLHSIREYLTKWGLHSLLESSRRGGHLWVLFSVLMPINALARLGAAALRAVQADLEVYPEASFDGSSRSYAQAMRLPLGIHRVSGEWYPFLDAAGRLCHERTIASGLSWLIGQYRHTKENLRNVLTQAEAEYPISTLIPEDLTPKRVVSYRPTSLIDWVNQELDLLALIAELHPQTALRKTRMGYAGWCAFHEDDAPQADGTAGTPSLWVVFDRKYGWSWRCYSTNCGTNRGPMHHTFDWLLWTSGNDMQLALDLAELYHNRAREGEPS
jgi:hypothetical protein